MNPLLSGVLALVVMLPFVLLLGWLEAHYDQPRREQPEPKRNTWPDGEA